jgi:hypothetical protein
MIIALSNDDLKNKLSVKLTSNDIILINNIISLTPNSLKDINESIHKIIIDNKIDTKDVPSLLIVIQVLYRSIYSLRNIKLDAKKRAESTANILKFIIHLLVLEKKIVINDDKQQLFLSEIDTLIDTSVELLSLSKSLKTKGCFKIKFF